MAPGCHNLNIKMYSFKELLALFKLSYTIDINELKRAKMMVLKMHPDKSRLPPDYFLFYKKAFDVIVDYYNETQKVSVEVPQNEIVYQTDTPDKSAARKINSTMKEMGAEKFQQTFNTLFEKNMVKTRDDSINDWFKSNDPLYQFDDIQSTSGLGQAMDTIKQKTSSMIEYKGVQSMNSVGPGSSNLYEEDGNASGAYVSCDPFGKLKYDDLRKVHKDQTVFAVSERDFSKMQTYSSMDHLQRERGSMNLTPIEKTQAEQMMAEREEAVKQQMLAKKHAADLRSMEYAEKNKSVMSAFFHLTNG